MLFLFKLGALEPSNQLDLYYRPWDTISGSHIGNGWLGLTHQERLPWGSQERF
jgi:hypothetical protein